MAIASCAAMLPLYHPNQINITQHVLKFHINKDAIRVIIDTFSMTSLGLHIRIPSKSLIQLQELHNQEIVVKFNGTREVAGRLKSSDKQMNMILEDSEEIMGVEDGQEMVRQLGLIIIKGSQIQSISLRDGFVIIDNPYTEAEVANEAEKGENEEKEQQQEEQEEEDEAEKADQKDSTKNKKEEVKQQEASK